MLPWPIRPAPSPELRTELVGAPRFRAGALLQVEPPSPPPPMAAASSRRLHDCLLRLSTIAEAVPDLSRPRITASPRATAPATAHRIGASPQHLMTLEGGFTETARTPTPAGNTRAATGETPQVRPYAPRHAAGVHGAPDVSPLPSPTPPMRAFGSGSVAPTPPGVDRTLLPSSSSPPPHVASSSRGPSLGPPHEHQRHHGDPHLRRHHGASSHHQRTDETQTGTGTPVLLRTPEPGTPPVKRVATRDAACTARAATTDASSLVVPADATAIAEAGASAVLAASPDGTVNSDRKADDASVSADRPAAHGDGCVSPFSPLLNVDAFATWADVTHALRVTRRDLDRSTAAAAAHDESSQHRV